MKKILATNKYFKKSQGPPEYGNNQSLRQVLGFSKDIQNLQKLGVPNSLLMRNVKDNTPKESKPIIEDKSSEAESRNQISIQTKYPSLQ